MSFQVKHVDNVDDIVKYLAEDGAVVLDNVLDKSEVAHLRGLLLEEIENDRQAGVLFHDGEDSNERLLDIVNRRKEFRDLVERPLSLDIVSRWLKPRFRLSSFGANVTAPGSGSSKTFIHADQSYVPAPWPSYPLALNLIWALDDFTKELGATHILPGSHRNGRGPDTTKPCPGTVPILCDAGSLIVMDGRVWHHTGANTTADRKRAALLTYFVNWFIIPQQNWEKVLSPKVQEELSPVMRELLGFGQRASMVLEQFEGA
jgi:ectoine hydroxylase-related dioxygenase (phytanoyl-CoA dioxygenase family)